MVCSTAQNIPGDSEQSLTVSKLLLSGTSVFFSARDFSLHEHIEVYICLHELSVHVDKGRSTAQYYKAKNVRLMTTKR